MSRRRKKRKTNKNQPVKSPRPAQTPLSHPDADSVLRQSQFDAMSDTIRGEEILQMESAKKEKQAREIKKKLDKAKVDRKLEELRSQLGMRKK